MTNWDYHHLTPFEKKHSGGWNKGYTWKPKGEPLTKPKHSPTALENILNMPWHASKALGKRDDTMDILDENGGLIAQVYGEFDAKLIVRAANAHDELVSALEEVANDLAGMLDTEYNATEEDIKKSSAGRAFAILDKLNPEGRAE